MPICYKHFLVHPYQVNCFVVYDDASREAVLVDPACWTSNERSAVSKYVVEKNLELRAIINTHMHYDHNASNVYFQKLYNIPVWAHEGDDYMLHDPEFMRPRMERIPLEGLGSIDRYLEHGEKIKLGESELEVIHTPGHSPGGICLYCADSGFLISGDTLFCESIGRTDFPKSDHKGLLRAITTRLFVLPDETIVLPGHDQFTTVGHERKYSPFLLQWRNENDYS